MLSITGGHLIAMLALAIPLAAVIMNGLVKMRRQGGGTLSEEAERTLMERAERLHERVGQLETILDAESPGWRARAG